jgi:hypothetical protein
MPCNSIYVILIYVLFLALGLATMLGAYRRWRWLVDPPDNWPPFYSQVVTKRLLGRRFLLYSTYALGLSMSLMALYELAIIVRWLAIQIAEHRRPRSRYHDLIKYFPCEQIIKYPCHW